MKMGMKRKMNRGNLFIVTGPSGAGKGTVLGKLLPAMSDLHYSISATTRAPRPGEIDCVNYYFINKTQFLKMAEQDKFLEYAEYVGNYYGTPSGPVDEMLEKGIDVILEIEVQGALIVKNKRPEAKLVFIIPPSFSDLECRLRTRGSEQEDVIMQRLEKARSEYKMAEKYDYIVVNDEPDRAVDQLRCIIMASRCTVERRKYLLR